MSLRADMSVYVCS